MRQLKKAGPDATHVEDQPTATNSIPVLQHTNASRQVQWWTVHEFVKNVLDEAGSWPMVGSVEWNLLDDDDPVKVAAIYDAAQHWALRLDTNQQALADTSRDVSGAADWSRISRELAQLNSFRAQNPWTKRVAS